MLLRLDSTVLKKITEKNHSWQQHIKTMLKPVSNCKSLLACLADCPADNQARPLALFLYETL